MFPDISSLTRKLDDLNRNVTNMVTILEQLNKNVETQNKLLERQVNNTFTFATGPHMTGTAVAVPASISTAFPFTGTTK